jgi:hypothetical protein
MLISGGEKYKITKGYKMKKNISISFILTAVLILFTSSSWAYTTIHCGVVFAGFRMEFDTSGVPQRVMTDIGYSQSSELTKCTSPQTNVFMCEVSKNTEDPSIIEIEKVLVNVQDLEKITGEHSTGTMDLMTKEQKMHTYYYDHCDFY